MAYVPVPKDLNAVKTKVLFNLTKRQLVCFGSGAAVGVPLFFLLRQSLSNSAAAICMIVVMLPFFLFALYEKNGLPLEKIIKNIVQVCFIRPKVRPYETDNFYAVLQRQDILDKEVYSKKYYDAHESDIIIHKAAKKAFDELTLKKLPTVKSLQAEYSDLLVQKKLDYAALAKAREEARQLQIYKANAEMLLRTDADEQRQTREHQQEK